MSVFQRGSYWVTDDLSLLDTFLTHIGERYRALAEAGTPLSATVSTLEKDWTPRWEAYWKATMTALTTLRLATRACKQVFEQGCQESPVPLVLAVTALAYTSCLVAIEAAIEEAGILITAYSAVCRSSDEKHIRQRQRVLAALQAVTRETSDAVLVARTQSSQALTLHSHMVGGPNDALEVR